MFSFTNPELVHETILTNYLAVLTLDDSPIDKLKLLMSVSGKIIEEFNGYVTPPKKDNTVSILLLEKKKIFSSLQKCQMKLLLNISVISLQGHIP